MFRLITFLLFVNFASCFWHHEHNHCYGGHGHHRHSWHHHHNDDNDFESLAQCVISADNLLKTSCTKSVHNRTRVYQGLDFYVLKYYLQEFTENSINVVIKHRVIYVTAQENGIVTFKDLRILPDSVKTTDATWYFEDGLLRVLLPYKNPLKSEVILTCGDTDQTIINVPKLKNDRDELRFLKEST
ncbi:unnamed protein product [Parnassius mnemosyne]|uniref:Uncharacterized protein n=1 Tax=Parnassius mnemosyne TaxID=213953 RepID=A0AAV1M865_9NEOP